MKKLILALVFAASVAMAPSAFAKNGGGHGHAGNTGHGGGCGITKTCK
jgi:hypothetical protein